MFRAFTDQETSELAVMQLASRHVLGIQIKTVGVDAAHAAATVSSCLELPPFAGDLDRRAGLAP